MSTARGSTNLFLDTRGDSKVQNFSGLDSDWDAFKIKFEAYTDRLGMSHYMDEAETELTTIDKDLLSTQEAAGGLRAARREVRGQGARHCDFCAAQARARGMEIAESGVRGPPGIAHRGDAERHPEPQREVAAGPQ